MPIPPSVTITTRQIPTNIAYTTWGKLRSILVSAGAEYVITGGDYHIEWEHGFQTAEGNGLLLVDAERAWAGRTSSADQGPYVSIPRFYGNPITSYLFAFNYDIGFQVLQQTDVAQLIGQDVSIKFSPLTTSNTITLTAEAFPENTETGQIEDAESGIDGQYVIESIGLMTKF
jgi:hypothetical protein